MRDNIGSNITKYDMCAMACRAYLRAMTPMNIIARFKNTGIYPPSKESVPLEKLFASEIFRKEEPLRKVQAIKGGKDVVDMFLSTKVQKSTEEKCKSSLKCYSVLSDILVKNELCIPLERGSNVLSAGEGIICLSPPSKLKIAVLFCSIYEKTISFSAI